MQRNIEPKIEELKEIALQILNIIEPKAKTSYQLGYAYTYLKAMSNGEVKARAENYGVSLIKAYESQLIYAIGNLNAWRGNEAKQYKLLLKAYLSYFKGEQNTGQLKQAVSPIWSMVTGIGD